MAEGTPSPIKHERPDFHRAVRLALSAGLSATYPGSRGAVEYRVDSYPKLLEAVTRLAREMYAKGILEVGASAKLASLQAGGNEELDLFALAALTAAAELGVPTPPVEAGEQYERRVTRGLEPKPEGDGWEVESARDGSDPVVITWRRLVVAAPPVEKGEPSDG